MLLREADAAGTLQRNIFMMYLFNFLRIFFPFVLTPYLTRTLSVDFFGAYVYMYAILMYLKIFIDYGFDISGTRDIARLESISERCQILCDIVLARFALCIVGSLFIFAYVLWSDNSIINDKILFLFFGCLECLMEILFLDFYFKGIEKMDVMAMRFFLSKAVFFVLVLFLVQGDNDFLYIPICGVLGNCIGIYYIFKNIDLKIFIYNVSFDVKGIYNRICASSIFFAYRSITTIFSIFNTILIGTILDSMSVAIWGICLNIISGIQALYTPISMTLFPHIAKKFCYNVVRKILIKGILMCIFLIVSMYFIAPYVISFIAGDKYIEASCILSVFTLLILFSFPANVLAHLVLIPLNGERYLFKATLFGALFHFVSSAILFQFHCFTLLNVVILRCFSEMVILLIICAILFLKNKFNIYLQLTI